MESTKESITVNTDASYFPNTKIGGYGIWISNPGPPIKSWGQFKEELEDSNEAELKAVINAFHLAINKWKKLDIVWVNCDNQTVRNILKLKKGNAKYQKLVDVVVNQMKNFDKVIVKTIKGHKSSHNARQYVNNWCDEYARKGAKLKRR